MYILPRSITAARIMQRCCDSAREEKAGLEGEAREEELVYSIFGDCVSLRVLPRTRGERVAYTYRYHCFEKKRRAGGQDGEGPGGA